MLVQNWKEILKKAWSVRLILVAGLLSGLEIIMPMFVNEFPRNWFAVASFFVTMLAIVARLMAQYNMGDEGDEKQS